MENGWNKFFINTIIGIGAIDQKSETFENWNGRSPFWGGAGVLRIIKTIGVRRCQLLQMLKLRKSLTSLGKRIPHGKKLAWKKSNLMFAEKAIIEEIFFYFNLIQIDFSEFNCCWNSLFFFFLLKNFKLFLKLVRCVI